MFEKIIINTTSLVIAIVVLLVLFRVFNLWNLLPGGSGVIGVFAQAPAPAPAQPVMDPAQMQPQYQMDPNNPYIVSSGIMMS